MIIKILKLTIIITIAIPIIFIILLKVSPRCNFGQTSFSQPGGNTWHLHRGTFLHPLRHHHPPPPHFHHHYHRPYLILINITICQCHTEITRGFGLLQFPHLKTSVHKIFYRLCSHFLVIGARTIQQSQQCYFCFLVTNQSILSFAKTRAC